ncbi:MAG TPA: GNAT family N-acetyltransferase [Gaiellaceae bacterium]
MGAEAERRGRAPQAALADDVELVRTLFREYADALGVDLSFQGFEEEVAALPAGYDVLLLAGDEGCVGVRPFEDGVCEMKRLYVRPSARGSGLGRTLALAAIDRARALGYRAMRLDTMPMMESAQALYESLGFVEIRPYRHNPVAGTRFMELQL